MTYTWRTHWKPALAVLLLMLLCGVNDVTV